jgi:predicted GH43/DUF377 family glycosyl hydrolase
MQWAHKQKQTVQRIVLVVCIVVTGGSLSRAQQIRPELRFEKQHRIILDLGGPGSFDECNAKYPCVLRVGNEWWMWYNGRAADCFTGQIGLAKSSDGLRWIKVNNGQPVFRHGPAGTFDSTKVDHPAVLQFGDKFHMWYTAGDQRSRYKIGYATSPDGVNWQREQNAQPVLRSGKKGKFDDQVVLHPAVLCDDEGLLHMWYNGVGPQKGFRIGHATSHDGIHWTRQNDGNPVLSPGNVDGHTEDYVYNVMVLLEDNVFHMWYSSAFGLQQNIFKPNSSAIVYAWSQDGTNWTKDPKPVFYNGPRGSLDEYSAFAGFVVRRNDALWMYYSCGSLIDAKDPRRFRTTLAIHRFRSDGH